MDIRTVIKQEKGRVDAALEKFLAEEIEAAKLTDAALMELIEKIKDQSLRGGKRGRPLLVKLAYKLGGGTENKKIEIAALFVELTHQFLLYHDDIADRDLKRYGGPTLEVVFGKLWKKRFGNRVDSEHFGRAVAMVSGDLTFTLAHKALMESKFEADKLVKVEVIMAGILKQVVAGWYMHMSQNHQRLEAADEKKYLKGMKLVSGSYTFEGPLMIGLALAGKEKSHAKALTEYAYHAGMAFQLQDDVLGVFGETEKTGKPVGGDVREGKKTVLIIEAYRRADSKGKKILVSAVGNEKLSSEELHKLQKLVKESGALEYSLKMAEDHVNKAKRALKLLPESKEKSVLEGLADFVVKREY